MSSFVGSDKSIWMHDSDCNGYWNNQSGTVTFTGGGSSNIVWSTKPSLIAINQKVYFTTSDTLPTEITANTIYFIQYVSGTTIRISTTKAGTAITFAGSGTGTHTISTKSWEKWKPVMNDQLLDFTMSGDTISTRTISSPVTNNGCHIPATWSWSSFSNSGGLVAYKSMDGGPGILEVLDVNAANTLVATFPNSVTLNDGDKIRVEFNWAALTAFAVGNSICFGFVSADKCVGYMNHGWISQVNATWTQSGTTITITFNNHGFSNNEYVYVTVSGNTTSLPINASYLISNVATNTFTITSPVSNTLTGKTASIRYANSFQSNSASRDMITTGTRLTNQVDFQGSGQTQTFYAFEIHKVGTDNYTVSYGYRQSGYDNWTASQTGLSGIIDEAITGFGIKINRTNASFDLMNVEVHHYDADDQNLNKLPVNWAGSYAQFGNGLTSERTITLENDITIGNMNVVNFAAMNLAGSFNINIKEQTNKFSTIHYCRTNNAYDIAQSLTLLNDLVSVGFFGSINYNGALKGSGNFLSRGTVPYSGAAIVTSANDGWTGNVIVESGFVRGSNATSFGDLTQSGTIYIGGPASGGFNGSCLQIGAGTTVAKNVDFTRSYGISGNYRDAFGAYNGATIDWTGDILYGSTPDKFLNQPCVRFVKTITNVNVTLSGEQTINGVSLVTGDLILVTSQTTLSQRGVWVVNSSAWTRPSWYTGNNTAHYGMIVVAENVGSNKNIARWLNTNGDINVGVTTTSWEKVGRRVEIYYTSSNLTISGKISDTSSSYDGVNDTQLGVGTSGQGVSGTCKFTNTSNDFTKGILLVTGTFIISNTVPASGASVVGTNTGSGVIFTGDGSNNTTNVYIRFDTNSTIFSRTIAFGVAPSTAKPYIQVPDGITNTIDGAISVANRTNATYPMAFEIGTSGQLTVNGVISGAGYVAKEGAGTLLLNGTNTYSQTTKISVGLVGGTGTCSSSAFTVASGATIFGGTGESNAGTFGTGALTLSSGSLIKVNIGSTTTVSRISVSGNLTFNSNAVTFQAASLDAGTYTIFQYTGSQSGTLSAPVLDGTGRTFSSYSYSGGNVTITLT